MDIIPTIQKERPPFVRFDKAEHGIDQEATEKEGRPVPRMVHMAYITTAGSKDSLEFIAEDWLARIMAKAKKGEYPFEWAKHFNDAYQEYLKGAELPRDGTPILTWAMIASTTRRKQLIASGVPTVEDLAAWPDSGLGQIGLDGRYLRDLAKAWVQEARTVGSSAKELADAKSKIESLEATVDRQGNQLKRLAAKIESMEAQKLAEV